SVAMHSRWIRSFVSVIEIALRLWRIGRDRDSLGQAVARQELPQLPARENRVVDRLQVRGDDSGRSLTAIRARRWKKQRVVPIVPGSARQGPCKAEHGMKKVLGVHSAPRAHWVGDGFPVRSLFG